MISSAPRARQAGTISPSRPYLTVLSPETTRPDHSSRQTWTFRDKSPCLLVPIRKTDRESSARPYGEPSFQAASSLLPAFHLRDHPAGNGLTIDDCGLLISDFLGNGFHHRQVAEVPGSTHIPFKNQKSKIKNQHSSIVIQIPTPTASSGESIDD